jgi:predicted alpha/beta hydrolase
VLPGVGVPQRVFRHIGSWLAERGLRTVSIDYRGMFGSGGRRGEQTASLTAWARLDAVGALRYIERTFDEPVLLLAHSIAGQMLGLHDDLRRTRAVVTMGSCFGNPSYFSGRTRLFVLALWYVTLPLTTRLFGHVPSWAAVGERLPAGVGREWGRWGRSPGWLLDHHAGARDCYARFDRPILALRARNDRICTDAAARALLGELRTASIDYVQLSPEEIGASGNPHMSMLRAGAAETVWPRILDHFCASLGSARQRAA